MSALPRRVEFVISLPLSATTDTEAEGLELKQMLAMTAMNALAGRTPEAIARHIVITDDVWTTAPLAARAS